MMLIVFSGTTSVVPKNSLRTAVVDFSGPSMGHSLKKMLVNVSVCVKSYMDLTA